MELKDFITETIKQITDGVLEGDKYVKEKSKSNEGIRHQYTQVDFDIAVNSNEEEKGKMGGFQLYKYSMQVHLQKAQIKPQISIGSNLIF